MNKKNKNKNKKNNDKNKNGKTHEKDVSADRYNTVDRTNRQTNKQQICNPQCLRRKKKIWYHNAPLLTV